MKGMRPFFPVFFLLVWIIFSRSKVFSQEISECIQQTNCSSCIQANPNCAWCATKNTSITSAQRCDQHKILKSKCPRQDIVNPRKSELKATIIGNETGEAVQLQPQKLSFKIRPHFRQIINIQFEEVKNYPVDVYYLMDLTFTMRDDKEKLLRLSSELGEALTKITKNFLVGFGTFVDKKVAPYVNLRPDILQNPCSHEQATCIAPYGFINQLSLTKDINQFVEGVKKSRISGNVDKPEGTLDAMMQAIVCGNIGWRSKARKILLVVTDDEFHIAGDGKLGGIIKPNDGRCHLNKTTGEYTKSTEQDYPSIGLINKKMKEKDISVIFAVTGNVAKIYEDLTQVLESSYSGYLEDDSSNVIQLLKEQYEKITSTVELQDNAPDKYVRVTYETKCLKKNMEKMRASNKCTNLTVGAKVEFQVRVEVITCPKDPKDRNITFKIAPKGLSENLTIELELVCECDCQKMEKEINSPACSNAGTVECGICNCNDNYFGETCECDSKTALETWNDTSCRAADSSIVCSGKGQCACGTCKCDNPERVYGAYCQCDNLNCPKHDNILCGGQGKCDCGQCKCYENWDGTACECPSSDDGCVGPHGGVCGSKGVCECGKCNHCISPFGGEFCEENWSPGGKCMEYRNCAECVGFPESVGPTEDCSQCNFSIQVVHILNELEQGEHKCTFKNDDGCNFFFTYVQTENEAIPKITVQELIVCPEPVNVALVVGAILAGILLFGLLLLLLWRLVTYLKDKREYETFLKECSDIKFGTVNNELFKETVGNYVNPTFGDTDKDEPRKFSIYRSNKHR